MEGWQCSSLLVIKTQALDVKMCAKAAPQICQYVVADSWFIPPSLQLQKNGLLLLSLCPLIIRCFPFFLYFLPFYISFSFCAHQDHIRGHKTRWKRMRNQRLSLWTQNCPPHGKWAIPCCLQTGKASQQKNHSWPWERDNTCCKFQRTVSCPPHLLVNPSSFTFLLTSFQLILCPLLCHGSKCWEQAMLLMPCSSKVLSWTYWNMNMKESKRWTGYLGWALSLHSL